MAAGDVYSVTWLEEDQEWVATHNGFPSLSYLAPMPVHALAGLQRLIADYRKEQAQQQK
jgi:hypothetical protein